MRQIKTWICKNCNESFDKVNTGHTYLFCSRSCAAKYNKPSQILLIPTGKPMSRRTEFRRRSAAGETRPVFRYPFNEQFFDDWNDELAWLIGIIWTDGCLFGNTIDITSADPDLIEMIEGLIDMPGGMRKKSGKNAWRITFTSKQVTTWLRSIGLTPAKSFTIKWPKIPVEYETSFMRGVIDGDGWVSLRQKRQGQYAPDLIVGVCTASLEFARELRSWFDKHNIPYSSRHTGSVEQINIREQESLRRLYSLLYPAGEWTVALLRKHSAWAAWLQIPRTRSGRPSLKNT